MSIDSEGPRRMSIDTVADVRGRDVAELARSRETVLGEVGVRDSHDARLRGTRGVRFVESQLETPL